MIENTLKTWHELVQSHNPAGLDELLHDDVVFHSPVVHTPQRGKQITQMYLTAAFHVLFSDEFSYVREVVGEREAVECHCRTVPVGLGDHARATNCVRSPKWPGSSSGNTISGR